MHFIAPHSVFYDESVLLIDLQQSSWLDAAVASMNYYLVESVNIPPPPPNSLDPIV